MGSRDVGGVSVDSETSFDTDSASLSTSGQIVSYSPLSEHAGSQFDSRDSFGRDDQHSIVTNSSGPHALGLHRASIATDGSGSIQIGLDPELRSPTPTRLTLRLGVQSSQDRPRNVKSSPEEISRTSLPVKDTGKIIALALSPSGDRAALLFRHACRVYLSGDIVTENIFIKLKRNAQWTRLCIGSQYLVVYGTERGKVFQNRVSCPIWDTSPPIENSPITMETGPCVRYARWSNCLGIQQRNSGSPGLRCHNIRGRRCCRRVRESSPYT